LGGTDDSSIKKQLFDPFEGIVKYSTAKYLFHLSVDVPLNKEDFPLKCIGIDTKLADSYKEWEKTKTPHLVDLVKSNEKPQIQSVYIKLSGKEDKLGEKLKDLDDNFGTDRIKRIWSNIWDYIWGGTLEDNKKFENFNKVLLAKIYDERKTKIGTPYVFQRKYKGGIVQTDIELANDIDLLYRKAYREYLSKDKSIELINVKGIDFKEFQTNLIAKCVELLQSISFHQNRFKHLDTLGEFYETVIRSAFKQTKGLFLTHPNIVLFILSVLDIEELVKEKLKNPDEDNRYRLPFVIDPSCGTGTFLVLYMQYVQKYIERNHKKISGGDEDISDFIERNMLDKHAFKWVIDYVHGLDNEPVLATACQINMILHGDGSTNIYNADGLDDFNEYSKMEVIGAVNILSSNISEPKCYYSKKSLNKFDIIISNPPFSVNINKNDLQNNFEITGKSEAYFLERWYQLLKPGGRIGVVLPESFFSVEEEVERRIFLYTHFNIKAIVSLPNHAFQPHTTTSTSLLFASKKTTKEEEVFNELWQHFSVEFDKKYNKITENIPSGRESIDFNIKNRNDVKSIFKILHKIEELSNKVFGAGFVVLPYYEDKFLFDEDNFNKIKKSIRDTIASIKNRWILHQVSLKPKHIFYNFSIDEIGYKAGKKGSKDKPNDLMSIFGSDGKKLYNIKYSHTWDTIDTNDKETVLGLIKDLRLWQ
jgi:type I restriction enzyme M protein